MDQQEDFDPASVCYFDNAATSWPKPPAVVEAMSAWLTSIGGSPGRSGHRMSIASSRLLEETRELVAELFNFPDVMRVIFNKNITEALNTAIFSLVRPGSHVVTSAGEHNSLMRPLRHLEKRFGVELTLAEPDQYGRWTVDGIVRAVRNNTSLIAVGHASNVTGMINPVDQLRREMARTGSDLPVLVDGAQSAGAIPVDLAGADRIVYAFTGHKSLLGPTGTGGMLIGKSVDIKPLIYGGTGSRSDEDIQPSTYPDKLESGTGNMAGIAGLRAAVEFLTERGVDFIRSHEKAVAERFISRALEQVKGITIYGSHEAADRVAVVSYRLDNLNPSQLGLILDRRFGIMSRIGLHCNPNCHKSIGTFPDGTVRFSFSPFSTIEQADQAVAALAQLAL
ncbi:MAG: aminotransferase class V-fold PLP-dependent enzyme [Planctomycetes bacterium]|nr:aminotransferase class V-fold PLP-dependent enzyme [Planctomycetota bacterium]